MQTQNNEVLTEGKRLTLYELMQSESWSIEIPIIQRDYAQGRTTAYEVRSTFVGTLLEHLQSNENIDLDFIYGSLKENTPNVFIPLDGQQRLTTLFLLHWYLAHKEDERDEFLKIFASNDKSRFSYETRTSSREFCDALVTNIMDLDELLNDSISETIKDAPWFYLSWQEDPTIQSMLTMLDEIHKQFKEQGPLFRKLLDTETPVITFQFLNLDAFKLTDDLYIKMNARGKQLTSFENFKAKFEQHIKGLSFTNAKVYSLEFEKVKKTVPEHEYFSFKIDTDWANLFWKYKNDTSKVFDDQLMNFLKVMATNYVASKDTTDNSLRLLNSRATLSFQIYKKTIGCLVPEFILQLIDTLDYLKNGNDKIKNYLSNDTYINEDELFEKAIANNLNYTERIRFYALYQYLLKNGNANGLEEWIRVIYNLTENTIYNELEEYGIAIASVNNLVQHSSSILHYLSTTTDRIQGFLELQVLEERIKACLMLKGATWYNKVLLLEQHGYFNGQISFLLNFAGIEAYYKTNNHCNWNAQENKVFFDNLSVYYNKAASLFNDNGLINYPDYIVERVLLSKGDYTLSSKSNRSFLVNVSRDISWKRLLRDDNYGKRTHFKSLLDDIAFNYNSVSTSLKNIINASPINDWRKHFIELPDIIDYLGTQKYFRFNSATSIQLLQKERLSGPHAEYYSYAFYLHFIQNNEMHFAPFSSARYVDVSGDYLPYVRLTYSAKYFDLDISWVNYPSPSFRIEFLQRNKLAVDATIDALLAAEGFNQINPWEYNKFVPTETDAYNILDTVCNSFTMQKL